MPNLKPATGKIRFREDSLSVGISFDCKFYISPFNQMVADEFKKMRIEGDFFDLEFNPSIGTTNFSFSFGDGIRLEVKKFRDAFKLLTLLSKSGKKIVAEFLFDSFPKLEFGVECHDQDFNFSKELKVLDRAVKVMSDFDITDLVDIALDEIYKYESQICQMEAALVSTPNLFKVEFDINDDGYDPSEETACIFLVTKNVVITQRIVSEKDESISNEDLVAAIESIEEQYDNDFSVVTMFDKSASKAIKPKLK